MDYMTRYEAWLHSPLIDDKTKAELSELKDKPLEIEDRFIKDLEFGTGGLRGKMGAGTNRMNIYTVRKATQGLANYLNEKFKGKGEVKVAIAFDSRLNSPLFAKEAALCFAANGIKAYIFDSLRPTPMLSFAIRHLKCASGIVITASHNPAIYNGYKVYAEDGCQITPPEDEHIISFVNKVQDLSEIKTMDLDKAKVQGLYNIIPESVDEAYYEAVAHEAVNPELFKNSKVHEVSIVYSPLHGTGYKPMLNILKRLGFTNVHVVEEQCTPDGHFPTVRSPNPEDPKAFTMALELAQKVDADLVFATDPDADRIGMYVKDEDGKYQSFNGNMSGALMLHYVASSKKALHKLPANPTVVSTIVSGKMSDAICQDLGLNMVRTLTGFKYIGEKMTAFERDHSAGFVFGYEESYGALLGNYARDKDAIVAGLMLCEIAAYTLSKGTTIYKYMQELFAKYGYYQEDLVTVTLEGLDGAKQITALMDKLRQNPPKKVGAYEVLSFNDYLKPELTKLPKSNVLYATLSHDAWFCLRPSGTEPKIKLYLGVKESNKDQASKALAALKNELQSLLNPDEAHPN